MNIIMTMNMTAAMHIIMHPCRILRI
jgi:hypothetical protein